MVVSSAAFVQDNFCALDELDLLDELPQAARSAAEASKTEPVANNFSFLIIAPHFIKKQT
jgi:hypothetical protein